MVTATDISPKGYKLGSRNTQIPSNAPGNMVDLIQLISVMDKIIEMPISANSMTYVK